MAPKTVRLLLVGSLTVIIAAIHVKHGEQMANSSQCNVSGYYTITV